MALGGGVFLTQNKALPGAYLNFVSAAKAAASLSDRGVAAMAVPLDWGVEEKVFEVTREAFQKDSLALFGYPYTHEKLRGLRDLFRSVKKACLYRLGGGKKAENIYGSAKYAGARGNALKVVIEAGEAFTEEAPSYDFSVWFEGQKVDEQQGITEAGQLKENPYLDWKPGLTLDLTAGTALAGGTDTVPEESAHQLFLDQLEAFSFHALGCLSTAEVVKGLYTAFTKRMRDEVGVKFQTVLYDYKKADCEGVISVKNRTAEGEEASAVWWVTGAEAGCGVNKSLTNRVYDGEFLLEAEFTQAELSSALSSGELVLHKVGQDLRVLEDVNTFVSVTEEKSGDFSSNQTIRVLDQIAVDVAALFEQKYLGQVPNDAAGRISLWNDIVKHHQQLEGIRAIEGFLPENVEVGPGDSKKSVVVSDRVTPTNAMAQLYMTIVVA